jgi:nucleotide-binding universal stress UspA family protein
MFDRIVVPLDGSAFAEAALIPARELAARFGSTILLTTAVEPLGLPPVRTRAILEHAQDRAEVLSEAGAYLLLQVEKLRNDGFTADMTLYVATAGSAIAGAAELGHADLIVMATHMGWTVPADGSHRSSVTLDLLARSRVPILSCHIMPTGTPTTSENAPGVDRSSVPQLAGPDLPVVVPLDGSPFAEQALPTAQAVAEAFGAYLILVCALPAEPLAGEHGALGQREALDYLARLREQLEAHGVNVTTHAEVGVAINVIEHIWRERGAGMLIMASHGKSRHRARQSGMSEPAIPESLVGSVAAEILEELEVPALVIQPEMPTAR